MIDLCLKILVVACLASVQCVPHGSADVDTAFIGQGTNDLAKALLQGFVGEDENMVYSPLGYSAVLAVFAEGSRGESREEIATALHFPKDVNAVRLAYQSVIGDLYVKKQPNTPEFKNWFYVYKNYTVEDDLKQILEKYYLTEVKSVDRPDDYLVKKDKVEDKVSVADVDEPKVEETVQEKAGEASTSTDQDEVMIAMQRSQDEAGTTFQRDHISGMTDSSLKIKGKDPQSQMIIFNGLHFKGDWKEPFVKKPADDTKVFYKSEKEKISVSTIHSQGEFNVANIEALDCRAIELPYKGDRYSLLILVPNARDGLAKLISDLSVYPINDVYKQMKTKLVDVCLPNFEMDCISKPISSFSKLGLSKVTSIFDPEKADLSAISKEPGLYVEELVQMVSFKVDAEYSNTNFLTASIGSLRSNYESFPINQPFLFFLKDRVNDMVIVNGKLVDPTPKPDFFSS
ncbi:UNVERIFIED_CONTAM: hypothetical protein PYX00_003800 [Menopon gallinae]|uniref:Serpin domain-containing protein n=1 Tax=Menopon gallinae TaxID=328185 RepID=A0AAW2I324_9NEOP